MSIQYAKPRYGPLSFFWMFPLLLKGLIISFLLGRVASGRSSQQNDEGGEVFNSESEYSDDGGNNDVEMSDPSAGAAQGLGFNTSALGPPLPKTPTPATVYGT